MKWLRHKWAWAKENPLFWCNLLFCVDTFLYTFHFPGSTGFPLRVWSLVLQLFGVATVWYDLSDTARSFGKTSFFRNTLTWLKQLFAKERIAEPPVGLTTNIQVGASLNMDVIRLPSAGLDARVSALESDVKRLREDLSAANQALAKQTHRLDGAMAAQSAELKEAIERVNKSLEDAAVGNRALLAFGALWLTVGIALSTFEHEIVMYFGS
jgi:hypothetical protein